MRGSRVWCSAFVFGAFCFLLSSSNRLVTAGMCTTPNADRNRFPATGTGSPGRTAGWPRSRLENKKPCTGPAEYPPPGGSNSLLLTSFPHNTFSLLSEALNSRGLRNQSRGDWGAGKGKLNAGANCSHANCFHANPGSDSPRSDTRRCF